MELEIVSYIIICVFLFIIISIIKLIIDDIFEYKYCYKNRIKSYNITTNQITLLKYLISKLNKHNKFKCPELPDLFWTHYAHILNGNLNYDKIYPEVIDYFRSININLIRLYSINKFLTIDPHDFVRILYHKNIYDVNNIINEVHNTLNNEILK